MSRLVLLLLLSAAMPARAGDWPTYRADAARSGLSSESLPAELAPGWVFRARHPASPAWPTSERVTFDRAAQPIVVDGTVLVGTSADDRLLALDLADGHLRWTFFAAGPIRFAPAAWRDRVLLASDDGWLYALAVRDGRLLWKFRGGPDDRQCLGNERLISRWPARGGPVVFGDTVYFAAGIWPSDGVYLHALDARTGKVLWTNDRTGRMEMPQPHGGAVAASGVAPQGYLLADDERLYVPTGRAVPAVFRRSDGELLYYHLQKNHTIGGARTVLVDRCFYNGGFLFDRATGDLAARCGPGVVSAAPDGLLQATATGLNVYAWQDLEGRDRKGQAVRYRGLDRWAEVPLADRSADPARAAIAAQSARLRDVAESRIRFQQVDPDTGPASINQYLAQSRPELAAQGLDVRPLFPTSLERDREVIVAGREAVCGGDGWVKVVDPEAQRPRWSGAVEGRALGLAVSRGCLLVSTDQGRLYCFTAPAGTPRARVVEDRGPEIAPPAAPSANPARIAAEILDKSQVRDGLCVHLGCGTGELSAELARQSSLTIYAVEQDADQVAAARQRLLAAGLYGTRVVVHQADPRRPPYPKWLANLVVALDAGPSPDPQREAAIARLQRPFGGVACWGRPGSLVVRHQGPPPDCGQWTHQNADAANTLCSQDAVHGPLSMLWYRDVAFELPDRHGQAPAPLFSRGCLVEAGVHGLCALDAYNGRTLWTFRLPNLLADYDGVHHDVAVGETGGVACLGDRHVFVRTGPRCLKIDLASGRQVAEFATPEVPGSSHRAWGHVAWQAGVLLGSVANEDHPVSARYRDVKLYTESELLFAVDPEDGHILWRYRPEHSLRHNALAVAEGRVYLIDRPLALQDRIVEPQPNGKQGPSLAPGDQPDGILAALDLRTGQVLWRQANEIFGTQLAVSPRGVLLMSYQAVKHKFFRLPSEIGGRMAAFDANTGRRLWDQALAYTTRPILNGPRIIAEGGTWDLDSGNPLPLEIHRSYGCGQFCGSRNLVLFRSATLGYHDLSRTAGTENFGGMRPGCWFNAIPAGGLVLVPDGSSKCACSYPLQAWFALQGAD